jgi:hypothetical protein
VAVVFNRSLRAFSPGPPFPSPPCAMSPPRLAASAGRGDSDCHHPHHSSSGYLDAWQCANSHAAVCWGLTSVWPPVRVRLKLSRLFSDMMRAPTTLAALLPYAAAAPDGPKKDIARAKAEQVPGKTGEQRTAQCLSPSICSACRMHTSVALAQGLDSTASTAAEGEEPPAAARCGPSSEL